MTQECQRKVAKHRHPISYKRTSIFNQRKTVYCFQKTEIILQINAKSLLKQMGNSLTGWSSYKGNSVQVHFQA